MKLKSTSIIRAAFAAVFIATGAPAGAQTVLSPPAPPAGQTPKFGTTVVTGERFILIADTGDDQRGENAGAVYVHNAATGAFVRKITAADGAAGDNFGSSVALNNDTALIGANLDDDLGMDSGSAYIFNLNTGTQTAKLNAQDAAAGDKFGSEAALQGDAAWISATGKASAAGAVYAFRLSTRQQNLKLTASDGRAGDIFGSGLALSGSFALVGASGDDGSAGACYLFDADRGILLRKITASDRTAGDAFGGEVSMSGDVALIGAAGDDDLGSLSGSAYLIRVSSGSELRKLHASDGNSTDLFGSSVSLHLNVAVVGAPIQGSTRGQAYVFDASTGVELRKLVSASRQNGDKFGTSVSVYLNRIVVGAPQGAGKNGQAFIFNDQSVPAPMTVIATKNAAAPNIANATFNTFTAHTINGQGESMLAATLNNVGANNAGLWNRLSPTLDLMLQKGQSINGPIVAAIQTQVLNNRQIGVAKVQLSGAGVNAANDIQLIADNGNALIPLLRESQALNSGGFTGQVIRDIKEVTASYSQPQAAFFATFAAPAPLTADSGIVILDLNTNAVLGGVREGDLSPFPRVTIGAIAERATFTGNAVIANVALTGAAADVSTANNAALLQIRPGQATTAIARKGDIAPGTTDTFTAFTAETVSTIDEPVFLASLTGAAATNQGIWTRRTQANALSLVVRKSSAIFGQDGSSIGTLGAFTRFWSLGFGKVLVQAKLALTAPVTAANDDVILVCTGSSTILLFREGDTAPNCDGARITTLQKVDADPNSGDYAILTTLSSGAATNQALWIGDANATLQVNENALLRPVLTLRKDSLHTVGSISARLTSMDMTLPADATSASGRGLGSPVAADKAATVLSYGVNIFAAIANRQ